MALQQFYSLTEWASWARIYDQEFRAGAKLVTLIMLMLNHAECILVVSRQTALRAAVARLLLPLGYRVEIASSEKTARQLMGKERFAAAVVAPATLAAREAAFLRDVLGATRKLVVLAESADDAERFAASFPEALVCATQAFWEEEIPAFLGSLTQPKTPIHETASTSDLLHFEGCTLDLTGCVFLDADRREVPLTRGEFALLTAFVRNPGRVLARAQLRNAVDGGGADAFDRSIDMLVARLRRKIEPDAAEPQLIVTVPGTGYKFVPSVRAEPRPAPGAPPPNHERAAGHVRPAERRQLTVLSCQILGFATLAAKLDPEDLERAATRVYAACAEVIAHFGGTMVQALGDSVLAYFGHPRAGENNAESAVRAALKLLRAVGSIEAAPIGRFQARVGIATGLMVVGELGSVGAKEPSAMGEALNLALHMQRSASADGVVIAATTRGLIGRFFHCREIAPVVVNEGYEPAPAWCVLDEIAGMPRFDAVLVQRVPRLRPSRVVDGRSRDWQVAPLHRAGRTAAH